MSTSGMSYIGRGASRQPLPVIPVLAALLLSLSLTACAATGLPFERASATGGHAASTVSADITGSVDMTDWDSIRRAVVDNGGGLPGTHPWSNAHTGSSGTFTTVASATPDCRVFTTTINDLRGIRGYRGEACRIDGGWQLRGVVPDDSVLL